jgi:HSP20 family protein
MATLTRWDPFREMSAMRNLMDRFWEENRLGASGWGEGDANYGLALDVAEDSDSYLIKASIPGVNPEDVEITIQNNVLTIRGEVNQEQEKQNERYHVRERRTGSFMRSIMLPSAVDREKVEATCEHGVLTLRLPKSDENKPRRISINPAQTVNAGNQSSQVGEGHSSSPNLSNGESKAGNPSEPAIAPHDREAGAGGHNGQSQPMTDEQSSSAQSMEGVERPH